MCNLKPALWTVLLSSALLCPAQTLVIRNATVIDGTGAPPRRVSAVVVARGRITGIHERAPKRLPRGARVIEAKGKYVIPGLWDMHVHLWDEDPRFERYLAFGVTGIRDMGSDLARARRWREQIEAGRQRGPRIFLAGPVIDGREPRNPKLPTINAPTPAAGSRAVDAVDTSGADYVKVMSSLDRDSYLAVAQRARLRRIPFAGHLPRSVSPWEAIDARQKSMEHLFGLLDIGDGERQDLFQRMRMYGMWQAPTLVLWRREPTMQPAYARAETIVREMSRAGIGILAGTDTGDPGVEPGAALHDELELLVSAGLTPLEALQSATRNAAAFFGREEEFGTVQGGRSADLVILDADPLADIRNTRRIHAVILRGRVVRR